jgi:beta-carotene 15,15'-dioxygenase
MVNWPLPSKIVFARRVAPVGNALVGWLPVPSDQLRLRPSLLFIALLILASASALGVQFDGPMVTLISCAAILIFGLPHGTFDLALIRQADVDCRMALVVALYIGCAAVMYAVWTFMPPIAFAAFLLLAIAHFAEDWAETLPPFIAVGTATSLLTGSVFVHRDLIENVFAVLIGGGPAFVIASVFFLVAPLALVATVVAMIIFWNDRRHEDALALGLALCATIMLPPVVGFALFFCLMHSPKQFGSALDVLGWSHYRQWVPVVAPLTIAAFGIAAVIFASVGAVSLSQTMVATAFTTLSVLTLPHMAVPMLLKWLSKPTA